VKKGVLAIPLRDHTKGSFQINDEGFLIYSEPIFSKKREVTKETVISTDKNEAPVILTGIISALNRHQHLNRLKRIFYLVIFLGVVFCALYVVMDRSNTKGMPMIIVTKKSELSTLNNTELVPVTPIKPEQNEKLGDSN